MATANVAVVMARCQPIRILGSGFDWSEMVVAVGEPHGMPTPTCGVWRSRSGTTVIVTSIGACGPPSDSAPTPQPRKDDQTSGPVVCMVAPLVLCLQSR